MDREEEIRVIAYQLWEAEGFPNGREEEHWHKAVVIWEERNAANSAGTKKAPAKKSSKSSAKKTDKTVKKSSKKSTK